MIQYFHKPETLENAIKIKKEFGNKAFFIGGGTEINSKFFRKDPEHLIDLSLLHLNKIVKEGDKLIIGAGCTIQEIAANEQIPAFLRSACNQIFNRNIRNMATLGGHIGNSKSCGDVIPTLIALEAEIIIAEEKGESRVTIVDYINSESESLITAVALDTNNFQKNWANDFYRRSSSDLSVLVAAITMTYEDSVVKDLIVSVGGVSRHVIRLNELEAKLNGQPLLDQEKLEKVVSEFLAPVSDHRGSAKFKKYLASTMVSSAIHKAVNQKGSDK